MKYRTYDDDNGFTPQRRLQYYGGMVLSGIGLFLILSIFVSAAMSLRAAEKPSFGMFMLRGLGGMTLMIVGGIVRGIGEKGLDVSSTTDSRQKNRELDPFSEAAAARAWDTAEAAGYDFHSQRARKETEPFTETVGYFPSRANAEEYRPGSVQSQEAGRIQVMIRCHNCRALSPENANFCDQCGEKL